MTAIFLYQGLFLITLILISLPLGKYVFKVMIGEKVFTTKLFSPIEKSIYRIIGKESQQEMSGKRYGLSLISFTLISFNPPSLYFYPTKIQSKKCFDAVTPLIRGIKAPVYV